jgi:NhaA family Na+:H+ antiporter
VPTATDIAFALAVLALLGDRIPSGLKVLLLGIAIADDIGAIVLIAVFYSHGVNPLPLAIAVAVLGAMVALRRAGVWWIPLHIAMGTGVWLAVYFSGVHATIAGVALGLATPARPLRGRPVLDQLQHRLHPLSSYLVVPLFALANAGVPLGGDALGRAARSPVAWGVALGLVGGKLLGVAGTSLVAVRLRLGALPEGLRLRHVVGLGALAGIGFTVSLLIAELAYPGSNLVDLAKVGILAGSLASGLTGAALLATVKGAARPQPQPQPASRRRGSVPRPAR